MQARPCQKCRRLFMANYDEPYCATCGKDVEKILSQVKDYIRENPGCTTKMVVKAMDNEYVTEKQIKSWVKEDRIQFVNAEASGIVCDACRKPIASGRYCDSCRQELQGSLNNILLSKRGRIEEEPKRILLKQDMNDHKMRYLGR